MRNKTFTHFPKSLLNLLFLSACICCGLRTHAQGIKNIELAGQLPYGVGCVSALWGYTDTQGREFALVGLCNGFSVVDITVPATPAERYFIPGPNTMWREIKTWGHYAYCVTEAGTGLTIIDLGNLPDTNLSHTVVQTTAIGNITNVHTIWIDEQGHCFLYGCTGLLGANAGCAILDLNADPLHPTLLGIMNGVYFHDGYVRGDTLWAAAMYEGEMQVYDITDPLAPVLLGSRLTPGNFTHNIAVNDEGTVAFTTDEVRDAFVTAYDVTDLQNIRELDRIQMDRAGHEIPHNVHYLNGWLPTAYYREGVVIIDAHRPENMVITGYYDTHYPDGGGTAFAGVWETYAYFPSGRMIASDMSKGLFIFNPTYVRACYLEGVVTDTVTGASIPGANVGFSGLLPGDTVNTVIDGSYKTGTADPAAYSVTYSKPGYMPKTYTVTLTAGTVTERNVQLRPVGLSVGEVANFSGMMLGPVPATATVQIKDIPAGVTEIKVTDMNGRQILSHNLNDVKNLTLDVSGFSSGVYFVTFGGNHIQPETRKIVVQK